MKGLVLGLAYAFLEVYIASFNALEPLYAKKYLNGGNGLINCSFWYILTKLVLLVVAAVVYCVVMRWYKKRKREDVLPNEQIFAERYYSSS